MKRALITGVTGQDGSYLAESLLNKGYEVHGIIRRSSSFNTGRISKIFQENGQAGQTFFLHYGDLTSANSISNLISNIKPDEIYNLGAQSHVKVSFEIPTETIETVSIGTLNVLESIRNLSPNSKLYQASSSEMYGSAPAPQDEKTNFEPQSPYAAAKVLAFNLCKNYREGYGIFASNGILFNHESPRRGETFVTRKITRAVARIHRGIQQKLILGNLDAIRDWGFAPEYVEAMWMMLQQPKPDDFVIATGISASVRDFVQEAFNYVGLNYEDFVITDEKYFRPTEVNNLRGNSAKALKDLGWEAKTNWKNLVKIMVDEDLKMIDKKIIN
jgi:GDPmannose 4,6-dehydratase